MINYIKISEIMRGSKASRKTRLLYSTCSGDRLQEHNMFQNKGKEAVLLAAIEAVDLTNIES